MINTKFHDFVFDQVEKKLDLLNETIMSSQTTMLQSADPLLLTASDSTVLNFLVNTWK